MNSETLTKKTSQILWGSLFALTACGSGESPEVSVAPSFPGSLQVIADDALDFDLDRYQTSAGEVHFSYVLNGFQVHTLVLEGFEEEMRLEVANGETAGGTLTLTAGRYVLYCDIAGHREAGMEAQLLVE